MARAAGGIVLKLPVELRGEPGSVPVRILREATQRGARGRRDGASVGLST